MRTFDDVTTVTSYDMNNAKNLPILSADKQDQEAIFLLLQTNTLVEAYRLKAPTHTNRDIVEDWE